ncbi:DUF6544 family protein [Clostridium thermarum]|uniref:DUF6544 family protein n=1 Tax=Clostridium thermarum TaxID=1716543 RepID=UPI001FA98C26|nr:DUF6544 family protein [Clostridium thermarum]
MDKKYMLLILLVLVIVVILLLFNKCGELKNVYNTAVQKELEQSATMEKDILTEEDIKDLPEPVQKYIRYSQAIGKEKVRNFTVTFEGKFKADPEKGWAKMKAKQYTDLIKSTRLYYMDMKMFGLPVYGVHRYIGGKASMLAKLGGLLTVVDGKGPEMNEGETVTVFNDMCVLAPGSLIDERIEWETVDSSTVKATFTNEGIKIHAVLYFNDKGELINFVSEDRYYSPSGKTYKKYKWSTPLCEYKNFNGTRISSGGEAVWTLPEGDYSYGKIGIAEIKYNISN